MNKHPAGAATMMKEVQHAQEVQVQGGSWNLAEALLSSVKPGFETWRAAPGNSTNFQFQKLRCLVPPDSTTVHSDADRMTLRHSETKK